MFYVGTGFRGILAISLTIAETPRRRVISKVHSDTFHRSLYNLKEQVRERSRRTALEGESGRRSLVSCHCSLSGAGKKWPGTIPRRRRRPLMPFARTSERR